MCSHQFKTLTMLKYSESYPFPITLVSDGVLKKTCRSYSRLHSREISEIVNHFINHPNDMVVPVYSFNLDIIRCEEELDYDGEPIIYEASYSYDMKRLCILSLEEKEIIRACLRTLNTDKEFESHIVLNAKDNYPQLVDFIREVMFQDIYFDLHDGNFLKDEVGDYRLCDLEGFKALHRWKRCGQRK